MKIIKTWLPAAVWMGIIFYFSGRQKVQVSEQFILNFIFFKTLHLAEYFVLYTLIYRTVLNYSKESGRKTPVVAILYTLFYAVTDEIHQGFVPTREGKLRDVIIDGIGGMMAWIYIAKLLPKAPQKLKHLAMSSGIIT